MATVRERKPGVWEVRAFTGRDERGRPTQISRTVRGTKKDAQRVAAELTVRPVTRAASATVAELLTQWVEQNDVTWAASTRRDNPGRAAAILADPLAILPISRVTVADIERWHTRMRRDGVGETAIKNRHTVLRAAFTQAVRWGWLGTNPVATARLTHAKQLQRSSMTANEVRRVLDAAAGFDPVAALALRIAAVAGARRAELAALRWADLAGDRLTIDSAIETERHGRRGHPMAPTLTDAPTKTGNRRIVVLDAETVETIEALMLERYSLGPWMLSGTAEPVNPDRIGAWWRRARKAAGIDPAWRLHDLRHWSATVAITGGHDVRTVAGRLGHANPAMTLRVYAHAVQAADEAVALTIGAALAAKDCTLDG
jgi:integrase